MHGATVKFEKTCIDCMQFHGAKIELSKVSSSFGKNILSGLTAAREYLNWLLSIISLLLRNIKCVSIEQKLGQQYFFDKIYIVATRIFFIRNNKHKPMMK